MFFFSYYEVSYQHVIGLHKVAKLVLNNDNYITLIKIILNMSLDILMVHVFKQTNRDYI